MSIAQRQWTLLFGAYMGGDKPYGFRMSEDLDTRLRAAIEDIGMQPPQEMQFGDLPLYVDPKLPPDTLLLDSDAKWVMA